MTVAVLSALAAAWAAVVPMARPRTVSSSMESSAEPPSQMTSAAPAPTTAPRSGCLHPNRTFRDGRCSPRGDSRR